MSNKNLQKESKGAPRFSFSEYGMSRERYLELRDCCTSGKYSTETLRKACRGFEFIEPWILLSVTKRKSFDRIEFDTKLGHIPCGRTDFYGFRRKFYHNLNEMLRKDGE